ncbi:GAF domain-containing hybrid sensor histidine kinase/response regulator [Flavobacterium olei]|uniref:GAF domain-containing hybrid sensor histidine kinase/response regulator n=1 Tax=Flavobacterium olei TaxID=1886782 RepID=UPI00321B334F
MKSLSLTHDESKRIEALQRYNILETLPERAFNDATALVSYICEVPIAYISFVYQTRQFFKSQIGMGDPNIRREVTFSRYTIMGSRLLEIQDTLVNERFKDDPDVIGGLQMRFYAGIPLRTPDGYNIGVLCAADHSPRKLNTTQRLALKIVARHVINTLELGIKNSELASQKKIAECAVAAKDVFLANMSHEIRTPLNAITGFTELLAQTKLNRQQLAFVKNVHTAGEHLLLIVNNILDLSKIESGGLSLDLRPFGLKEALLRVHELLKVKAREGVEFNLYLSVDLPEMVSGDQVRLTQILINLAGNALKFTQSGEVTLAVKKIKETVDNFQIRYSVKDTGIGIPKDRLEYIFERFTQAEQGTSRKYGGTGLGLSIVKQLLELHGSKIEVRSAEGLGSEFFFTITYQKIAPQAPQDESPLYNDLGRLRILLCEDNHLNQRLARHVTDGFCFDLDIADNGKDGIQLLSTNSYDLILMDLHMPNYDGYQTASYIRGELKNPIPIIAITAVSALGERDRCLTAGMNGYVSKPFKAYELLEAITLALKKKSQSDAFN